VRWNYHWRTAPAVEQLELTVTELRADNVRLRHELQTKQTQLGGLKLALHQRHETIDALRGRIEQLQERNRQLDEETEWYAQMVAVAPAAKLYSD
jgi:chromosome segregation ATPase